MLNQNNSNSNPNPDVPEDDMGNMLEDMVDNVNNVNHASTSLSDANDVGNPSPTDMDSYFKLVGEVLRNETSDPWERLEPTPEEQEMFDTHDEFVAEMWEEIGKERGYGRTVEEGAVGGSAKMGVLGRIMPAIFGILTVTAVMLTVWQIFHWFKKK